MLTKQKLRSLVDKVVDFIATSFRKSKVDIEVMIFEHLAKKLNRQVVVLPIANDDDVPWLDESEVMQGYDARMVN